MAKRKKRQAKEVLAGIQTAVICFGVLIGIIFALLDSRGKLTYGDVTEFLGLEEQAVSDAELSVHYIDVGQGDCQLIICGDSAVLIDAGEAENADSVLSYIRAQGVSKLDYVIATHYHSDHIGALSDIISDFDVRAVIMPEVPEQYTPTSKSYENLLLAIRDSGLRITKAKSGDVYNIGDASLTILAPIAYNEDNMNNYSVVSVLDYGSVSFMFTGDAERVVENELLDSGFLLDVDVLKVGHHGSSTSSSEDFLAALTPSYCVIQCGAGNSYNHPNEGTVERLREYTREIYRNDLQGTIVIETDGHGINCIFEKGM